MIRVRLPLGCYGVLLLISSFLGTSSARANYNINKDLVNLGPTAYDLEVILQGATPILSHYDGPYPSGITFGTFSAQVKGRTTRLHWQSPNRPINTGETVHVGWTTPNHATILDMFWTDRAGRRIPGSVVHETAAHGFNNGMSFSMSLDNYFAGKGMPLKHLLVSDIQYAVLSDPIPLEDLNGGNQGLAAQLQPLDLEFDIPPGESICFPLPESGNVVVLVYQVTTPDGQSQSQDFVQIVAAEAASFRITAPATVRAGQMFNFTVTALDQDGNPFPGYTGTVHFSSSDFEAFLPANYTFTAADGGSRTFMAGLATPGMQSLTVTDIANPAISGTATIVVSP